MTKHKVQKSKFNVQYIVLMAIMLLTGCSTSDGPETITDPSKMGEPIYISIQIPTDKADNTAQSRVGDPGSDTKEGKDWDKLMVIAAYKSKSTSLVDYDAEPQKMVYWDTFSKKDFEKGKKITHKMTILDAPQGDNGTRSLTMYLPTGIVNIYGVTYTDKAGLDLEGAISNILQDGKSHSSEIERLTISNDYAQGMKEEAAKFLSVATGYAIDLRAASSATSRDLTISKNNNELEMKKYWAMYLTRLATKLDIQWDAKAAYEKKDDSGHLIYTDVEVSQFTYDGGATGLADNEKSGYGRLFPTLQTSTVEALGGTKTFLNTSEISKRNGRQYHYFFPDGSKSPSITFKLSTQGSDGSSLEKDYTFRFGDSYLPLQPGAWYKINTNIKGQSTQSTTITVGND